MFCSALTRFYPGNQPTKEAGTSNGSGFFLFVLADSSRRRQQFIGPWSNTDVFRKVFPAHRSGAIDEELRRSGDIRSVRTSAYVQQLVSSNHLSFWVGEKWEGVAPFATEILRNI